MVLLADVGGITGVIGTLNDIKVPAGAIAQIVAIIEQEKGRIDGDHPLDEVKPAWFGGGQSGATLGTHTSKAHATLSNAILEAVASLQGTTAAMTDFDESLKSKDEDRAAAAQALIVQTEQAIDQMDGNRGTPPSTPPSTDGRDDS